MLKFRLGLILFIMLVILLSPKTGDAQTSDPDEPTRQTTIQVPITEYEWWLIRWNDNEILCRFTTDHEGLPTPSEVLKSCGIDNYQDWQNTAPCRQIIRGTAGPSACYGLYLYLYSAQPTQKEVIIDLPEATAWISLVNCSPIPPDNLCTTLPSLLILGEEPLPNEKITAVQGTFAGKPFYCEGDRCELPLQVTPTQGILVEFWAEFELWGQQPKIYRTGAGNRQRRVHSTWRRWLVRGCAQHTMAGGSNRQLRQELGSISTYWRDYLNGFRHLTRPSYSHRTKPIFTLQAD